MLDQLIKLNDGASPTYRELAKWCQCKSVRTITEHVHALIRKGLVSSIPKEQRSLAITLSGEKVLKVTTVETIPFHLRIG